MEIKYQKHDISSYTYSNAATETLSSIITAQTVM